MKSIMLITNRCEMQRVQLQRVLVMSAGQCDGEYMSVTRVKPLGEMLLVCLPEKRWTP